MNKHRRRAARCASTDSTDTAADRSSSTADRQTDGNADHSSQILRANGTPRGERGTAGARPQPQHAPARATLDGCAADQRQTSQQTSADRSSTDASRPRASDGQRTDQRRWQAVLNGHLKRTFKRYFEKFLGMAHNSITSGNMSIWQYVRKFWCLDNMAICCYRLMERLDGERGKRVISYNIAQHVKLLMLLLIKG
jgi:hypothetical protein